MTGKNFFNCWITETASAIPDSIRAAASAELAGLDAAAIAEYTDDGDAFTITRREDKYIVTGGDTGVLYGAFRLAALLKSGAAINEISEKPSFTYRIINHWDNVNGSIERGYSGRSFFFDNDEINYDEHRIRHYARMLASVGINAVCVNNVNVSPAAVRLITVEKLPRLAKLSQIFRPYGIRLILSVNYASPVLLNELTTADPLDPAVARWWVERFNLIYSRIPDLLGVLVKADSENQPGPFTYGRDHAQGANMLAEAIEPHGGTVFWRCFVYNHLQDWRDVNTDRPMFPYESFMPLDGRFNKNVTLQIKNGPYDFQIREPVSPLLGAMQHTIQTLEFQIAQEYTGQQIDLCFLPTMWREALDEGVKTKHIAAVTNTGNDYNWTGNYLAGANLYGYGRLAWDASLTPDAIAGEWCSLMFDGAEARNVIKGMLLRSREIYENYTTPMGMGWFVSPRGHYGPDPLGYEFSKWGTYHRADRNAVGIDRSSSGSGFVLQYPPAKAALYDSIETCPEELLLFFHRVEYQRKLRNGRTLLQHLYDCHFAGAEDASELLTVFETLKGKLPKDIFENVLQRLQAQRQNAFEWRDVFNTFFYRLTGEGDEQGRVIHK
jgi:alpha-glucuronidase